MRRPSTCSRSWIASGVAACAVAAVGLSAGCSMWPFSRKDRTSIITPPMRAAAIREFAPRARRASEEEQLAMCQQLAEQIRLEPDPIIRKVIQETIAEFDVPLSRQVLLAGLNDDDRDVRIACCRLLGERKDASSVSALSRVVGADPDQDVRMAAVDALSEIKTPEAVQGIAAALKDRDPALQYAGVEAMKRNTGEKLGNDVEAWRAFADRAGGTPPAASVANQGGDSATR